MNGISKLIACALLSLPLLTSCGSPPEDTTDTTSSPIIGGWVEEDMVYTVAIMENGDEYCSGTLVDTRLVVTAAHCLEGIYGNLQVYFGINSNNVAFGELVDVDSYTAHPSYNPFSLAGDIGVIELSADAPETPAPMLDAGIFDNSWVGETARFVGYGSTNWQGAGYGLRRAVDVEIDQVGAMDWTFYSNAEQTCFGDSGGPGFVQYDGDWHLIGITSYGDPFCNVYSTNTRVDQYLTWIEGYMGGGGNPNPGGDEVTPGTETTGTLAADETITYWFETISGQTYDVLLDSTSGDMDLYTHPTDDIAVDEYTCRPYLDPDELEVCTFTATADGEYWIMVHGYTAGGYGLVVAESDDTCRIGALGQRRYCTDACPCGYGLGSCNGDSQCADGMACHFNSGDDFGLNPWVDVCMYP